MNSGRKSENLKTKIETLRPKLHNKRLEETRTESQLQGTQIQEDWLKLRRLRIHKEFNRK